MQLVIEISDGLYNNLDEIKNGSIASKIILNCVRKGQILPKGHGRLIDVDALRADFKTSKKISFAERMDISCIVDHAPTIIEVDIER